MDIRAETAPEVRPEEHPGEPKDKLLAGLGERVRLLRARRGMPRRVLAKTARVSERHLANLESGVGNVSVLVLRQVADALGCPIAELLGDETTSSPEWLLIREILHGRSRTELARAHAALAALFEGAPERDRRRDRIALIGLRGAGKSTLGRMLAETLAVPFVELGREITRLAGCSPSEIHALYGPNAYRRYEHQALLRVLADYPRAVIATGGGLVSEATTFSQLLANCLTIWLRASPEEHMNRVIAQGDLRPMADNAAAMEDLKLILAGRAAFYAKADLTLDTSGKSVGESFAELLNVLGIRSPPTHAKLEPPAPENRSRTF